MTAISYLLGNTTQAIFSVFPTQDAIQSFAITLGIGQAAAAIGGSAAVLGAVGGGLALWRQYRAPQAPVPIHDRDVALNLIRQGSLSLQQIPQFSNDEEIVSTAVIWDPYAIQYAGQELRQDLPRFRVAALAALEQFSALRTNTNFGDWVLNSIKLFRNGSLMQHLPEFRNDYEMIYQLSLHDPSTIREAGEELYQDPRFRELVLSIVRREPDLLEYAGPFRNDYEIVGIAIAMLPDMLCYAGEDLRQSPEFEHLQWIAHQRTSYRTGEVYNRGPQISYQEAISLLHRNPHSTLEQEIARWSNEYRKAFQSESNSLQLTLNEDESPILKNFLQRIREVQDYRDGGKSRANIVARVERMLSLASINKEFRGDLIALLTQALTDCDDNVLIRLNDIEAMSPLYNKNLTNEEYREAAIRYQRYETLKQIVLRRHSGNEELETLLYLQLKLKDLLPISTQKMGHRRIVNISLVRREEIRNKISSLTDEELLAGSEHWKTRMKDKSAEIDNYFGELMNDLDDYFGKEESEQKAFAKEKPELQSFLNRASKMGAAREYCELANLVAEEKARAIAKL